MPTGWKPPVRIRHATEDEHQEVRDKYHIITEGPNLLPPMLAFKDMRFPDPILKQLESKGIKKPTPIQIQGLPIILAGRDMIGVAFTGSGKTLVFALPMIMLALQEERRMTMERGEACICFLLRLIACQHQQCQLSTSGCNVLLYKAFDVEEYSIMCAKVTVKSCMLHARGSAKGLQTRHSVVRRQ